MTPSTQLRPIRQYGPSMSSFHRVSKHAPLMHGLGWNGQGGQNGMFGQNGMYGQNCMFLACFMTCRGRAI